MDYAALPEVFRMMGIFRREWPDLFDAIRIMERAALEEMHKKE